MLPDACFLLSQNGLCFGSPAPGAQRVAVGQDMCLVQQQQKNLIYIGIDTDHRCICMFLHACMHVCMQNVCLLLDCLS